MIICFIIIMHCKRLLQMQNLHGVFTEQNRTFILQVQTLYIVINLQCNTTNRVTLTNYNIIITDYRCES